MHRSRTTRSHLGLAGMCPSNRTSRRSTVLTSQEKPKNRALAVPCPECYAHTGEPCHTSKGGFMQGVTHVERDNQARRAAMGR